MSLESYMGARVTYPTGLFDGRWLQKAEKQAKRIPSGIPDGARRPLAIGTDSASADAPTLITTAFTSLGPQPLQSTLCQSPCFQFVYVSGRVNAIAIEPPDPVTLLPPNGQRIAYFGSDGGGVWKSTNCCNSSTTWTVKTDGANISTTAIDDIVIDPNNPNVVYAATGDISFGSFAFGSSGILKSTDKGETWTPLATNLFTPLYPTSAAGNYPQYQVVSKVEVDPNNSNKVIAGTKTGLFFSYDAGASWTGPCITNGFPGQRQDITETLITDNGTRAVQGEATTLYAAVGARGFPTTVQANLGLNGANGIYKTTVPASGCPGSWTLLTTQANGWPQGTGDGIGCDPPPGNATELCAANENKLGRIEMAIAPSTENDGNTANDVIYAEVQAVDPQTPCGVLQVLGDTASRGCFLGLWRTGNSGTTWTQTANADDLGNVLTAGPCFDDTPQNWYNQGLAVAPNDPNVLLMDTIDIWRSTDGGNTLVNVTCGYQTGLLTGPVHVDNHALTYVPGDPATVLAGNDGGIYVANNAAAASTTGATPFTLGVPTFADTNLTVSTIEFYSGDISANFGTTGQNPFIVGGAQDNGSSTVAWVQGTQGPVPWSQRIGGDGMYARIEPQAGQLVFMESQNGALNRSTNGPAGAYLAWTGGWSADQKSFVFPYEIDKNDCKTFARVPQATCAHMIAGSVRVWETINNAGAAGTWQANSPDLTKCNRVPPTSICTTGLRDRAFINQLAYAWSDNRVGIVGTNDGNVQYGFNLGQGIPNSALWKNVTSAVPGDQLIANSVPNRPILDVTIKPNNPLVGYAALGGFNENTPTRPGHVFEVTCTALCASFTWADKTGNLPNIPVDSIIANPNIPQQVFAGTDWGLYYTDNITAPTPTWFSFRNGLPVTMIWDMAIDRGATTLAVFTRSRGAFAWLLPTALTPGQIIFTDDMNDLDPWTVSHEVIEPDPMVASCTTDEWHLTQVDVHSPTSAFTNNPYSQAGPATNCINYLTSPDIVVPAGTSQLKLRFWEHHFTEGANPQGNPCNPPSNDPPCDFGEVEVTNDGGANWTLVSGRFEGGTPGDPYTQVVLTLPSLTGTIKVRFKFTSDFFAATPPFTGWSIDDVELRGLVPTGVTIASFTGRASRPGVELTWRTRSEAGILGYNVWRFVGAKGVKVNRSLVAAKGRVTGGTYRVRDASARPNGKYLYRLQVVTKDGKRVWRASTTVRVRR